MKDIDMKDALLIAAGAICGLHAMRVKKEMASNADNYASVRNYIAEILYREYGITTAEEFLALSIEPEQQENLIKLLATEYRNGCKSRALKPFLSHYDNLKFPFINLKSNEQQRAIDIFVKVYKHICAIFALNEVNIESNKEIYTYCIDKFIALLKQPDLRITRTLASSVNGKCLTISLKGVTNTNVSFEESLDKYYFNPQIDEITLIDVRCNKATLAIITMLLENLVTSYMIRKIELSIDKNFTFDNVATDDKISKIDFLTNLSAQLKRMPNVENFELKMPGAMPSISKAYFAYREQQFLLQAYYNVITRPIGHPNKDSCITDEEELAIVNSLPPKKNRF